MPRRAADGVWPARHHLPVGEPEARGPPLCVPGACAARLRTGLRTRPDHPIDALPPDRLRTLADTVLSQRPAGVGVWVFAYGSLMWDGSVPTDEQRPARLEGFERRYCLWDERERGTAQDPALTLGLIPGGTTTGVALQLTGDGLRDAFWTVWQHEMPAGFYNTVWVPVWTADGTVTALTFIADPAHPLFAGIRPDTDIAAILGRTHGKGGSAAEYLHNTVDRLAALGTPDPGLDRLARILPRRILHRAG